MIIIEKALHYKPKYRISSIDDPERTLLFDIETTGLSPAAGSVYLIGVIFQKGGTLYLRQWLAESLKDELPILREFLLFSEGFDTLVHFNGDTFDIRFIEACAREYRLASGLSEKRSVDLLKRVRKLKRPFGLNRCNQKSVEEFLGIRREDRYNGGELIEVYLAFEQNHREDLKELLLLHNGDDLRGMVGILPVLSYYDALHPTEDTLTVIDAELSDQDHRLTVWLASDNEFPAEKEIVPDDGIRLLFTHRQLILSIDTVPGEMKYFYPDHRDYYYLPEEDMAIHKKLAASVDKAHRVPATAKTCYTKTEGVFLPVCRCMDLPKFREDHASTVNYTRYGPDMLCDYICQLFRALF